MSRGAIKKRRLRAGTGSDFPPSVQFAIPGTGSKSPVTIRACGRDTFPFGRRIRHLTRSCLSRCVYFPFIDDEDTSSQSTDDENDNIDNIDEIDEDSKDEPIITEFEEYLRWKESTADPENNHIIVPAPCRKEFPDNSTTSSPG
ncbi:hypothetical protein H6P81_012178 [Aristolochia fimbriata]|uniref:Uncharacterized protein n=1 Tax=Aristolochia fimbriata TaxID=158543 RepID=A0AAV7ED63_ARIFI|nr:hypothetical protein H6P81_012178 [Aristolochia fimbriata]